MAWNDWVFAQDIRRDDGRAAGPCYGSKGVIPTAIGAIVLLVGIWLLIRGSLSDMFAFALACTLMGGSAAVQMPLLGGSTVPPSTVAILLMVAKLFLHRTEFRGDVSNAVLSQIMLLTFMVYCVAGAMLLPRIFEGAILVTPMKPKMTDGTFAVYPLAFTTQNITASVNIFITVLAAVPAYVMGCRSEAPERLATLAAILAFVHGLIGWYDVVTRNTPLWPVVDFFRNAGHSQVAQQLGVIPRMAGIFPEPSTFAAFGFGLMALNCELWIRNISSRWTGWATIFSLLTLAASTSTTAYLSILVYGAVLVLRIGIMGPTIRASRVNAILLSVAVGACTILTLMVLAPGVSERVSEIFSSLTTSKVDSKSALQRAFWAKQGINAFWVSSGIGIGAGSFRSSSLATAILGSTGIPGAILFLAALANVVRPFSVATYQRTGLLSVDVGSAFSWTALIMLVPTLVSAASPDPGVAWALIAGAATGLRSAVGYGRAFGQRAGRFGGGENEVKSLGTRHS